MVILIHRHKGSSETCVCIRGHFEEYFYDSEGRLTETVDMVPGGVVLNIEKGQWHSLKCLESGRVLGDRIYLDNNYSCKKSSICCNRLKTSSGPISRVKVDCNRKTTCGASWDQLSLSQSQW